MRISRRLAVLLFILIAGAVPAHAQVLYGAGPPANGDASQPNYFYRIDPSTAQVTQIGPIGFSDVNGMDVDPITGVIYATAFRSTGAVSGDIVLLTINPTTGQGTELMSWAVSNTGTNSRIAVRPSDGAIFVGWGGSNFARADWQDNDLDSVSGVPSLNGRAFDFGADGRIWWVYSEGNIFWRDLATGESGPGHDVFAAALIGSMAFHPNTGTLFVTGGFGSLPETLGTLDPTTGAVVEIGTFHPEGGAVDYHLDIFALAFSEEPDAAAEPISLWRAEGDALDSVDGNDGDLENGATFGPGKAGMAFSFDGGDDQVTVEHDTSLNPRVQMSISAWVNVSSGGHGRPIAQMRTTRGAGGYTFETTGYPYGPDLGLQWVIFIRGNAMVLQTPPAVLQIGMWHHVAATFDGTMMRIFVDGVEKAATIYPGVIDVVPPEENGDDAPFVIGRNVVITSFAWHGLIDELAIFGRALTTAQIEELFDAGGIPDVDSDEDGVADASDNCPAVANPDQIDSDADGTGNLCDADDDNDGLPDVGDNCAFVANPDQADLDGDATGNACDIDDDNDSVLDGSDNCPLVTNTGQTDADGDGLGDACDPDDDNDGTPDGPIAWWRAESDALDAVGANHGTLLNGTTFGAGVAGQAFNFDGLDDAVTTPLVMSYTNGVTFDLWMRTTDDAGILMSGGGGASVDRGMGLFIEPGGRLLLLGTKGINGDPNFVVDGPVIADGTFHHIAATWTGDATPDGVKLYVDGEVVATGTADTSITTDSMPMEFGGHTTHAHFRLNGLIDEVEIFNRVLPPVEILALFNTYGGTDPDGDLDGVPDVSDNCPLVANADQADSDGDGAGDACDIEPPGILQFSADAYPGTEGGGRAVSVTVVRTGGAGGTVAVSFATADGTAQSGQAFDEHLLKSPSKGTPPPEPDYGRASGRLIFASGETVKRFFVPIVDDALVELDETVLLTLSNPTGGASLGIPAAALLTIHDNDPNVSFDAAAASGAEEPGTINVGVSLSAPSLRTVTVQYAVTGGTAGPNDYQLAAGTLTFSATNRPAQSIRLQIKDDGLIEGEETIVIELSNPSGAILGGITRYTYTILASDEPAPDNVGNATGTARFVDLAARPRQKVEDFLYRGDMDVYRVHLGSGEFLALDVDSGRPMLNSSDMVIFDSDGVTVLATVGRSEEPDTGHLTNNPAYGFRAPHAGDYFIQLRSNDAGAPGYALELHRVALADPNQDPAVLDEPGPMFAWLEGNVLSLTGPTGYGFSLIGNWNRNSTTSKKSGLTETVYTMPSGTMLTLRSVLGDIPAGAVANTVTIRTRSSRWGDVVGEIDGPAVAIDVSIPFGALTGDINNLFGAVFDLSAVPRTWEIQLGERIKDTTGFNAVLQGVPYLLFNRRAVADAGFGAIDAREFRADILMVINPVDPSMGVRFGTNTATQAVPSWHFSIRGFVPSRPNVTPDAPGAIALTHFYGHAFSTWQVPILPGLISVQGMATVDLDANDDGTLEIDRSHASDLYAGRISAGSPLLRDVNIGFNGRFTFHYPGKFDLTLPKASFVYTGLRDGLWVKAVSDGVGGNIWEDSPFSGLEMQTNNVFEGHIFGDGGFFLKVQSAMNLPGPGELDLAFTLQDSGISVEVDGSVEWTGSVGIGGVNASCTAGGSASGSLAIDWSGSSPDYSGSLHVGGSVKCYAAGKKVASTGFSAGGEVDGDIITFDVPYLDDVSIDLP